MLLKRIAKAATDYGVSNAANGGIWQVQYCYFSKTVRYCFTNKVSGVQLSSGWIYYVYWVQLRTICSIRKKDRHSFILFQLSKTKFDETQGPACTNLMTNAIANVNDKLGSCSIQITILHLSTFYMRAVKLNGFLNFIANRSNVKFQA